MFIIRTILLLFHNFYLGGGGGDGSSNLKAGCKKDAIHDAFDTVYVICSSQWPPNILLQFFFQSCPVLVATLRSLPV